MSQSTSNMSETIYRFKFAPTTIEKMTEFSNTHRFDEVPLFRESWDRWCIQNHNIIEAESLRLKTMGCEKDVTEKMYKSVRYYYKNKDSTKREVKKRRQYISVDSEILDAMSKHIESHAFPNNYKPEYAYNNFVSNSLFNEGLDEEMLRLQSEHELSEPEVERKIKKTYKNRYYLKQKQ